MTSTARRIWGVSLGIWMMLAWSGCSIGPTTEVRYVIVHPGQPIRILENVSATGERMDGAGPTTVDLGGWIAMPPDHWTVIAKAIGQTAPAPAITAPGK